MTYRGDKTVILAQEQTPYILSDLPIQKITSIWH